MAKIYTKTISVGTDKCLILEPREALIYPFNIGNDWIQARLGFYFSMVPADNDNGGTVLENISTDTPANCWVVGLKNNNTNLPRTTGAQFWGVGPTATGANTINVTGNPYLSLAYGYSNVGNGTAFISGGSSQSVLYINPGGAATTGYANPMCINYTINDRGGPTQSVSIGWSTGTTATNNATISNLRAYMTTHVANAGSLSNSPWHDAGVPRPIPDTIFVRFPFVLNRVRIHAMAIERYA